MPTFRFNTQVKVVVSTMALHNFIRKYNSGDLDFMAFDDDPELILDQYVTEYYSMRNTTNRGTERVHSGRYREMSLVRDNIRDELIAAGLCYFVFVSVIVFVLVSVLETVSVFVVVFV